MKYFLLMLLSCLVMNAGAQKITSYPSSDSIEISGTGSKPAKFSMTDLTKMPDTSFAELKILNHHGEFKANYQHVRAVALKTLLLASIPSTAKPKELYSFFFVLKAMDGYAVVYSYNEVFSDPSSIFVLTAFDKFTMMDMPEKPMLLTLTATATGKIGMRGLKSIVIKKAE